MVADDKLRFDFSHGLTVEVFESTLQLMLILLLIEIPCVIDDAGKPINPKDLQKIEAIVSQQIKDELPVYAKEASLVEAKRIMGLRAVFGEVSGEIFWDGCRFLLLAGTCISMIRRYKKWSSLRNNQGWVNDSMP